ncbi:MAG: hypothetical protein ABIN67_09415 [Ferruginibacter sp.]
MAPHENEWEIKSLQTRYEATMGIELNEEQAEKVFLFEQEKNSGSYKYSFSTWEELYYEQDKLHEILTPIQFEKLHFRKSNPAKTDRRKSH